MAIKATPKLIDGMLSEVYGKQKGCFFKVREHYDIFHRLVDLEILECDEEEELKDIHTKFGIGMRDHIFEARDITNFIILGMRLKEMGYDHLITHIQIDEDEVV